MLIKDEEKENLNQEETKESEVKDLEENKEKETGVQKRINQLTAEKYSLREQLDEANRKIAEKQLMEDDTEPEKETEQEDFADPAMNEIKKLKKLQEETLKKQKEIEFELKKQKFALTVEKAAEDWKVPKERIVQEMVDKKVGLNAVNSIAKGIAGETAVKKLKEYEKATESESGKSEGASRTATEKTKISGSWRDAGKEAREYLKKQKGKK